MSKKGLKFLVIFLLIIIISLCGYIVYDKGFSKNNNSKIINNIVNQEENLEEEGLEVNDPLVINLMKKINGRMDCNDDVFYLRDEKISSKQINNETMYQIVFENMFKKIVNTTVSPYTYNDFTEQDLLDEIESVVGKGYKFVNKTYTTCPQWQYNQTENMYKAPVESACGCTTGPHHNINKITKALKEGSQIKIFLRVIFVNKANGKGYKDYAMREEITDLSRLSEAQYFAIDESNEENLNKGSLYNVVFEDENNNYIFKYAEPIE